MQLSSGIARVGTEGSGTQQMAHVLKRDSFFCRNFQHVHKKPQPTKQELHNQKKKNKTQTNTPIPNTVLLHLNSSWKEK